MQTDSIERLREASASNCQKVRFGSEFCMYRIPSLEVLKEALYLVREVGKEFAYVTPQASPSRIEVLTDHLAFLDEEGCFDIVINDLGVLNVSRRFPHLRPHLGRQLVFMPARCPWPQITDREVGFLETRRVAQLFYQTSMNYLRTIRSFQSFDVKGVDIDWIPNSFRFLDFLVENKLETCIHLHLVPVAVTRRCHTARFLKEVDPEECSQPCERKTLLLRNEVLGTDLFLHGNVVFRSANPKKSHIASLRRQGLSEVVITLSKLTGILSGRDVDDLIQNLRL